MWKLIFAVVILSGSSFTHAEPTTAPTTQSSGPLQEFLDRVPNTLADESIKSYDIIATFAGNSTPLAIRARKSESGHSSVYVRYTKRKVPMFLMSDDQAVQYDPAMGVLRRLQNFKITLNLNIRDGWINTNFAFASNEMTATQPVVPVTPNLDFRSLLAATTGPFEERTVGRFRVISGKTGKNKTSDFWIDPSQKCPLVAMVCYTGNDPFMVISRIAINKPIDEKGMAIPSDEELSAVAPVRQIDGFVNWTSYMSGMTLSALSEIAIEEPELRPKVEAKLGKIDWEKRIAADAEISTKLTKLIGDQISTDSAQKK